MQVRKKIEIFAFVLTALFLAACETTRSDSNELVQLDTANSRDMEFQSKLAKAVSPFGQLVNVYVNPSELELYRAGEKSNITNYRYLMQPINGTSLEDLFYVRRSFERSSY